MYRNVLVGGLTAAAILGAGGTALALTSSDGPTGTAATSATSATSAGPARHAKGKLRLLKRLAHAQIVTHGKHGFVTHDLVKGTVTAVSPTSITVQAADKTSLTFVVDKDTKVRVRSGGKPSAASIGQVAKGDQVLVAGTGASTYTAKRVVEFTK